MLSRSKGRYGGVVALAFALTNYCVVNAAAQDTPASVTPSSDEPAGDAGAVDDASAEGNAPSDGAQPPQAGATPQPPGDYLNVILQSLPYRCATVTAGRSPAELIDALVPLVNDENRAMFASYSDERGSSVAELFRADHSIDANAVREAGVDPDAPFGMATCLGPVGLWSVWSYGAHGPTPEEDVLAAWPLVDEAAGAEPAIVETVVHNGWEIVTSTNARGSTVAAFVRGGRMIVSSLPFDPAERGRNLSWLVMNEASVNAISGEVAAAFEDVGAVAPSLEDRLISGARTASAQIDLARFPVAHIRVAPALVEHPTCELLDADGCRMVAAFVGSDSHAVRRSVIVQHDAFDTSATVGELQPQARSTTAFEFFGQEFGATFSLSLQGDRLRQYACPDDESGFVFQGLLDRYWPIPVDVCAALEGFRFQVDLFSPVRLDTPVALPLSDASPGAENWPFPGLESGWPVGVAHIEADSPLDDPLRELFEPHGCEFEDAPGAFVMTCGPGEPTLAATASLLVSGLAERLSTLTQGGAPAPSPASEAHVWRDDAIFTALADHAPDASTFGARAAAAGPGVLPEQTSRSSVRHRGDMLIEDVEWQLSTEQRRERFNQALRRGGHKSRTGSAWGRLSRISQLAAAFYGTEGPTALGTAQRFYFPPSTDPTPPLDTLSANCAASDGVHATWLTLSDEAWDGSPTWEMLGFSLTRPYYSYAFTSSGVGEDAQFTATAYGDLDCDGELSTLRRVGHVEDGAVVHDFGEWVYEEF